MNIRQTELQILEILWTQGEMPASRLYRILQEKSNWQKSTTYIVLKKCIEKGFVKRIDPNFICQPLISREEVQEAKITDILHDFFGDSRMNFMSAFFKEENITDEEFQALKDMIERMK